MSDCFPGVIDLDIGDGKTSEVSFIEPNYSMAYSVLAPLVTEAFAFLLSGDTEQAMKSLTEARQVIEVHSRFMGLIQTTERK